MKMRLGIHKDWVFPGERTPLIDVTALMGLTTTTTTTECRQIRIQIQTQIQIRIQTQIQIQITCK